jgi:hypothetical protein
LLFEIFRRRVSDRAEGGDDDETTLMWLLFDSDAELSEACQRWTNELYFEINAKSVNFWP